MMVNNQKTERIVSVALPIDTALKLEARADEANRSMRGEAKEIIVRAIERSERASRRA